MERHSHRACGPCASAKRSCLGGIPCTRCISLDKASSCIVLPDKRTKPQRKSVTNDYDEVPEYLSSTSTRISPTVEGGGGTTTLSTHPSSFAGTSVTSLKRPADTLASDSVILSKRSVSHHLTVATMDTSSVPGNDHADEEEDDDQPQHPPPTDEGYRPRTKSKKYHRHHLLPRSMAIDSRTEDSMATSFDSHAFAVKPTVLSVSQQIYANFEPLLSRFQSSLSSTDYQEFIHLLSSLYNSSSYRLTTEQNKLVTKLASFPLVSPLIPSVHALNQTTNLPKEFLLSSSLPSQSSSSVSPTERLIYQRLDASSIPMIRYVYRPVPVSSTKSFVGNVLSLVPSHIYANAVWCDTFGYPLPGIQVMGTTGHLPSFVSVHDNELYSHNRKEAIMHGKQGQVQLARFVSSSGQIFRAYEMSQYEYAAATDPSAESALPIEPCLYAITLSYLNITVLPHTEKTVPMVHRSAVPLPVVPEQKMIDTNVTFPSANGLTRSKYGGLTLNDPVNHTKDNPNSSMPYFLPETKPKAITSDEPSRIPKDTKTTIMMEKKNNNGTVHAPEQCSLSGSMAIPVSLKSILPSNALSSLRSFSWLPSLSLIDTFPGGSVGSTNSPMVLSSSGALTSNEGTISKDDYLLDGSTDMENDSNVKQPKKTTMTSGTPSTNEKFLMSSSSTLTKDGVPFESNTDASFFEARLAASQRLTFFPHSLLLQNDPSPGSLLNTGSIDTTRNVRDGTTGSVDGTGNSTNGNANSLKSHPDTDAFASTDSRDGFDFPSTFTDPSLSSFLSSMNPSTVGIVHPSVLLDL